MGENAEMSQNIGNILASMKLDKGQLSTLAKKGDDELVERFMTENVSVTGGGKETSQSQLYMAAFWGIFDAVKVLIENGDVDINYQNPTSLWSPLHAATFQEHGKIVMHLLEHQADPNLKDSKGRTPADFASVSDKVWPLFAASGLEKRTEVDLRNRCVLRKLNTPSNAVYSSSTDMDMNMIRKEQSTIPINYNTARTGQKGDKNIHAASLDGDVLAGDNSAGLNTEGENDGPNFNAWRN